MGESESKITLDLTGRVDVPRIEGRQFSNFIQQEAFHRLRAILKTRVEDATDNGSQSTQSILHDRSHNAIAILGGRGSGKTTFILNALELLTADIPNPSKNESDAGSKLLKRVKVLDVIDPTLIEHKEHILITILSSIKTVVDERHKSNQREGDNDESTYEAVIATLKAVGEGLPALKEIGSNGLLAEAWDNPQYVLQHGLTRARSGIGLEKALKKFIAEALKYIGKDVFVLPLDDIDTNFESGWPILEVLRKYLTTPKLVVVLSGDFSLYSLLVRDQQWNLLKELDKIEGGTHWRERHDDLAREVSRLESQYLQKIIKPSNRIELLPLSFFWESMSRRDDFAVKFKAQDDAVGLDRAMEVLTFWTLYSGKQDDRHRLAMLILRQPTRTVISLLRALDASCLVAAPETAATSFSEPEGLREFHATMAETFMTELQSMGLMADRLNLTPTESFLTEVLTFLQRNNLWEEGYSLDPAFRDDAPSLASLCLGARLMREMRTSPGLIFEYLIKVCGTRYVKIGLPPKTSTDTLTSFLALDRQEQAGITASRMIGAIRSLDNKIDRRANLRGTVAVYYSRRNRRGKTGQPVGIHEHFGIEDTAATFDKLKMGRFVTGYLKRDYEETPPDTIEPSRQVGFLFNTWRRLESQLTIDNSPGPWFLRMVSIELTDQSGLKSSFLSVLPLIGCLAAILNRADPKELLIAMGGTLLSYAAPSWTSPVAGSDSDDIEDSASSGTSDQEMPTNFADTLKDWSEYAATELAKIAPLPPFVLARTWRRFQDTLTKIDEDVRNDERYAGWLLHRQIVAFLNAFLVEESRHRDDSSPMTLASPVTTDRYFLLNLKRNQEIKRPSTFNVIFSCPLWSPYLCPETEPVRYDKGEASSPVFKQHLDSVSSIDTLPAKLKEAIRINYRTSLGRVQIHKFVNMHDVLNSLLVMGRDPWTYHSKDDKGDPSDLDVGEDAPAPDAPPAGKGKAPK